MNRKSFLKRMVVGAGALVAAPFIPDKPKTDVDALVDKINNSPPIEAVSIGNNSLYEFNIKTGKARLIGK